MLVGGTYLTHIYHAYSVFVASKIKGNHAIVNVKGVIEAVSKSGNFEECVSESRNDKGNSTSRDRQCYNGP